MKTIGIDLENKKLQKLVDTSWNLFWRYGFSRVTIEEICQASGVSKMTFYKHFDDKIALVRFIFTKIIDLNLKRYNDLMALEIPFNEKVTQLIALKYEQTNNISREFFDDIQKTSNPELKKYFEEQTRRGIQATYDTFREAQLRGDIRGDIKLEFILYFLNHMMVLAKEEKLLSVYRSPHDLIMELINFFFFGVLPRRNE